MQSLEGWHTTLGNDPVCRPSGPLTLYYSLATGAFDPGRGYTSPPGLEPHVMDLAQRSGCLEEENAKTQGCKDAKVVDLPKRSGCLGYGDWNTWKGHQV